MNFYVKNPNNIFNPVRFEIFFFALYLTFSLYFKYFSFSTQD